MGQYKPREYTTQIYGDDDEYVGTKQFFDFVRENFSDKVQLPKGSKMLIPS